MKDQTTSTSRDSLVTAVIPTRNRPHLVARAVQSALNQTYEQLEVVVVIDGPDDATFAALDSIADPRLQILHLPESVGGSEARNTGVSAARGEWIAFLDDDDEWLPSKIKQQIEIAETSQCRFPVVSCQMFARSPLREYVWPRRLPAEGEPVSEYILARKSLFQGEGTVTTTTLLAKRELLIRVPFACGQRRHQEWDWLFRALTVPGSRLLFAPEPLATWYMDEPRSSISAGNDWRYSREWIERIRPMVTPRAYAAFLLILVTPVAVRSGERKACLRLLRDAVRNGEPRMMDLLLFCGMVLVPQQYRRRARALFSR